MPLVRQLFFLLNLLCLLCAASFFASSPRLSAREARFCTRPEPVETTRAQRCARQELAPAEHRALCVCIARIDAESGRVTSGSYSIRTQTLTMSV